MNAGEVIRLASGNLELKIVEMTPTTWQNRYRFAVAAADILKAWAENIRRKEGISDEKQPALDCLAIGDVFTLQGETVELADVRAHPTRTGVKELILRKVFPE